MVSFLLLNAINAESPTFGNPFDAVISVGNSLASLAVPFSTD